VTYTTPSKCVYFPKITANSEGVYKNTTFPAFTPKNERHNIESGERESPPLMPPPAANAPAQCQHRLRPHEPLLPLVGTAHDSPRRGRMMATGFDYRASGVSTRSVMLSPS
jgi:hypothetical protein